MSAWTALRSALHRCFGAARLVPALLLLAGGVAHAEDPPSAREPVVGLPCEGCDAVFEGMPARDALSGSARLTPPDQPGEPLRIDGVVRDGAGRPAPGVIVYAYQTDAHGIYPRNDAPAGSPAYRHGTLRAWVVADADGRYGFDTVRPASYPDTDIPQHVHMHVIEPGRCTYYIDDILFADDPYLTPVTRAQLTSGRGGDGVTDPVRGEDGVWFVTRDIVLGANIPGYPAPVAASDTPRASDAPSADSLYALAGRLSIAMNLEAAIETLGDAFAAGYETPMAIVRDSRLESLIASPEYRPLVRVLLRDFARENACVMVSEYEPGNGFVLEGAVVDEATGEPVPGAIVELVHTDALGAYSMQEGAWNPRLFAYLKTAPDGTFRVETVRPRWYYDDEREKVSSHVHYSIVAEGYRRYDSETPLDDDPLFTPEARAQAARDRLPVTTVRDVDGVATGTVRIPLQRASSTPR